MNQAIKVLVCFWVCSGIIFSVFSDSLEETAARDKKQMSKEFPEVNLELMFRFYREYGADLLDEWQTRCVAQPWLSCEYLRGLTLHFRKLESVRKSDRDEYQRLIEYELLQKQIRQLSREIKRLSEEVSKRKDAGDRFQDDAVKLQSAKQELRLTLETAFDESLRQQAYEIDKLEMEISELRRLIDERRRGRDMLLEQRFKALTE